MRLLYILNIQRDRFKLYKNQFFINMILSFFGIYVETSILTLFIGNSSSILIYVLLSMSIFLSLSTNRIPEYCRSIRKGEIVRYYSRPMSVYHFAIIEEVGNSLLNLLQMLPLFIVAIYLETPSIDIIFFLLSMTLSIILATLISVSIFSLSLILANFAATKALLSCLSGFFSGGMIPLILLPTFFQKLAYVTPFAYLVDGPIHIFHGENIGQILLFQGCWIVVFYAIGAFMFSYFEKKINVFGG